MTQIIFAVFHRDIPHHFTHRLSCEYKGNISSSSISKSLLLTFIIMGLVEAGFIWVLTIKFGEWIGIDGEVVDLETQQSYVFYFLLFSY